MAADPRSIALVTLAFAVRERRRTECQAEPGRVHSLKHFAGGRSLLRKSRSDGASRSGRGFEDHAVPLALQELNSPLADSVGMATLVVVGPRVVVGGLARQQMVCGRQHRMGHGDDRLLVAAMPDHPPIPRREGALRRAGAQTRTFTSPLASAPCFHVAEELLFVAKLLERDDDCADTYRCLTTLLMVQGPRGEDPVPLITPSDCVRSNVNLPHWTLMPLRPTILPVRGRSRL